MMIFNQQTDEYVSWTETVVFETLFGTPVKLEDAEKTVKKVRIVPFGSAQGTLVNDGVKLKNLKEAV